MTLSVLLLVTMAGQASAIQIYPTVSPANPAAKDKLDFKCAVTNNETEPITSISVEIAFSFWKNTVFGMHSEDSNTKDKLESGDIAPGKKAAFHAEVDLARVGAELGKSFTYSYSVYYYPKPGGIEGNRTTYTTTDCTMSISAAHAPKKTPGFDLPIIVPAIGIALALVWRKVR